MKQFLKPNQRKIVIFLALFIIASIPFLSTFIFKLMEKNCGKIPDAICLTFSVGLPTPFYVVGVGGLTGGVFKNFVYSTLIIDLIFWYFISCFISWIYDKLKKKPQ